MQFKHFCFHTIFPTLCSVHTNKILHHLLVMFHIGLSREGRSITLNLTTELLLLLCGYLTFVPAVQVNLVNNARINILISINLQILMQYFKFYYVFEISELYQAVRVRVRDLFLPFLAIFAVTQICIIFHFPNELIYQKCLKFAWTQYAHKFYFK